jgi:hypothetical protein
MIYQFIRFAYIFSFKWFNYNFIHILLIDIPEKIVHVNRGGGEVTILGGSGGILQGK